MSKLIGRIIRAEYKSSYEKNQVTTTDHYIIIGDHTGGFVTAAYFEEYMVDDGEVWPRVALNDPTGDCFRGDLLNLANLEHSLGEGYISAYVTTADDFADWVRRENKLAEKPTLLYPDVLVRALID